MRNNTRDWRRQGGWASGWGGRSLTDPLRQEEGPAPSLARAPFKEILRGVHFKGKWEGEGGQFYIRNSE